MFYSLEFSWPRNKGTKPCIPVADRNQYLADKPIGATKLGTPKKDRAYPVQGLRGHGFNIQNTATLYCGQTSPSPVPK